MPFDVPGGNGGPLAIPVGNHLFAPDALQASLNRTLPQLPPGNKVAVAGAVDVTGASVALVFQSQDGHWHARAAFEHDWTGDSRFGADFTFSK